MDYISFKNICDVSAWIQVNTPEAKDSFVNTEIGSANITLFYYFYHIYRNSIFLTVCNFQI